MIEETRFGQYDPGVDGAVLGIARGPQPASELSPPTDSPFGEAMTVSHGVWRPGTAKLLVVLADALSAVAAMTLAFRLRTLVDGADVQADAGRHLLLGAVSVPIWILVFFRYRLYAARHVWSQTEELRRIVHAVAVATVCSAGIAFALQVYVSRGWLVLAFVLAIVVMALERQAIRLGFNALRRRGKLLRPIVIVGGNAEGAKLCATILADQKLGYRVVGFVDDSAPVGTYLVDHRPVLGLVEQTLEVVSRTQATGVVIATTAVDAATANAMTRLLIDRGVHVELSCSLHDIAPERLTVRDFGGHALMHVTPIRRHGWRAGAKRVFDVGMAGAVLALASPFLLAAAIAIRLGSHGPTLFRQKRVGQRGELFEMLKLRTMVHDAESRLADLRQHNEADGPLFKMRRDPRITAVGRLLRRFSIDELPQLWNVLRGDMTLVGPRPALPEEMTAWGPEVHQRLRVKPGITGMWQVSGRSMQSFDEYARLDLYYVDNWSLWRDVVILCKTLPALLTRRGAY
jgi:exopolysaccharide biosynthesis polyprenyl glycosylphosphotransferase